MKINKLMQVRSLILLSVFFLGLYISFIRHIPNLSLSVMGDDGDGFFNLWLLENVRKFLSDFDLNYLINTHSFYPENNLVLFWSDNMIFPGLIYSLFYGFCSNPFLSYFLTIFTALGMGFACHYLFFREVIRSTTSEKKELPTVYFLFAMMLTYLFTFSAARIQYSLHFQNFWSFLMFSGLYGMLRVLGGKLRSGLIWIGLSFTLLCYIAMYYAVGLALLGILFFICLCGTYNKKKWLLLIRKGSLIFITTVLLSTPILLGYLSNIHVDTSQHLYGAVPWHLIMPLYGSFAEYLYQSLGIPFVGYQSESLVYIGCFSAVVALPMFCFILFQAFKFVRQSPFLLKILAFVILFNAAAWSIPRAYEFKVIVVTLAIALFVAFYFYSMAYALKHKKISSVSALLGLSATAFYGIAFGLSSGYQHPIFNPSLLGVFNLLLPGMHSIRAIGRFGSPAFGVLLAIIAYIAFTRLYKKRPVLFSLTIGCLLINIPEQLKIPYINTYAAEFLFNKTPEEHKFFANLQGALVVYPMQPFHLNSYPQLYFLPYKNLSIVNGYSGRSSSFSDQLILSGADSFTPESYALLKSQNIQYLAISKWRYEAKDLAAIMNVFKGQILLDSEHFLVVPL